MSYEPPFTITSKILNLVSQISEALAKIEMQEHNVITPYLRKINRIKTLAGTLEIEGNFLGEEKITAILEGKRVLGTVLELAEVNGAIKAYEKFEEYSSDSLTDLLQAHKILMGDILTTAGTFRRVNVGVGGQNGVTHVAPPYDRVPDLMHDLFEWLKKSDVHPLIKSSVFHYEFEFIHPFSDGNGRIGRLWQSVILYNYKKVFSSIATESIVRDYQDNYYKALEDSGALGESTSFIEYMLEMILEAIKKVGNEVGNKVGNALTDNQMQIVQNIKENPKISAKKLSNIVGISVRKIEENISKLKEMKIIDRVGGTRGYWEVLE
ncbi:MAG: Fic family protein [Sulfurimonas sp.]|uniref:Fic family protein n=1 Tax=Sulfurimonas sp. TaxID=2022749 RepID=UPI00260F8FD0|nr:Fic family protein [Sulfurimonas sp.]MDD2652756.1 Fic family protein [Sulfurimonas sp.]MDD3450610.1 Fic family protein [Sulfurimonas sp.]